MTPGPAVQRRGFRRRLTLAVVLVAAISSAALAILSFVLVRRDREASFTERSIDKAQLAATLTEVRLSGSITTEEVTSLIETLHRRTGMEVVADTAIGTYASRADLDLSTVADALEDAPEDDDLRRAELEIDGKRYLGVQPLAPAEPKMYFLFLKENLIAQMSRVASLLFQAWLAVVVLAALVGSFIARTALRPIARASGAAAALAEGMLDTRLPIERQDEFGAWAASFNEMAAALEQKIHELEAAAERERRFTSDVAHELRTPLSALVTSTQLLTAESDEMGPRAAWAAERLEAEVRRLRRLVEELLEVSRLDAGRESIQVANLDLRDLVGRVLSHHGWAETVQAELEPGDITTDPRRIDRVLTNLISNALEHGRQPVTVRAAIHDSSVILEVEDRGPGIPRDAIANVFDRFYKGDPARAGGSGLGLAIARENARLLGGDIAFQTTEKGTTFTARLPRNIRPPDSDDATSN